jgi:sulfoacetaldehyde dehydrogenase
MARSITSEEQALARDLLQRARCAMRVIERYDQAAIDRLCRAVAWATANEQTATRLAHMGVDESGLGDREGRPNKRFKILGILRDALRQKSMGII